MNPNQLEIKRVIVREHDQFAMDDTLPDTPPAGEENQIVVEWEAGATANADVTPNIDLRVTVFDHYTGDLLESPPSTELFGLSPSGDNENKTYEQVLNLPDLVAGHMYEASVWLIRGNTIVSFYQGPTFTAYA